MNLAAAKDFVSSTTFRIFLAAGFLVACFNFLIMFRGWVVAPQAEIIGASIFFIFLGTLPLVGMISASLRNRWGAWLVIISPIVALVGLAFTNNAEWEQITLVIGITVAPTAAIGAILLNLIGRAKDKSADRSNSQPNA